MRNKTKIAVGILFLIIVLLAWSPWITESYVKEELKREEMFVSMYSGENENLPFTIKWFPFGRLAYSYNDVIWVVTFYGGVL
ncbi:MAG TPA: hypothetical protein VJG30_00450 [Candidatus Nanoarchaeia archaeon]|nr:hypothetical protein [Candidatus Nanoarchaeia archaeon]